MPTQAQWEFACRAGTSSIWFPGNEPEDLEPFANLFDQYGKRKAPSFPAIPESYTDGHLIHAPVGKFRANRFGLHDIHGNVFEWCEDPDQGNYVARGGGRTEPFHGYPHSATRALASGEDKGLLQQASKRPDLL